MFIKRKSLQRARLPIAALVLSLLGSTGCKPGESGDGSDATNVASTQFAIDLDYSREEMFGFDIEQYLEENAPHLLPHAEEISHVAGVSRISPRAIIALMELQSGAIEDPDFAEASPFGDLSTKVGFLDQLRDVCARLEVLRKSTNMRLVIGAPDAAIASVLPSEILPGLGDIYQNLFPGVVSEARLAEKATTAAIPMQFPWSVGESWGFGGAHADDGSGSTLSSLDFWGSNADWGDPITVKVVAAAAGTLKRHSSCYVTVLHGGNWSTGYYHLGEILVSDGAAVTANQPIAKYANTRSQALCDGGSSDGPHVHWTLYSSNREVSLDGKVLSGWTVHPGTSNYDENCARMYLTRNGVKACTSKSMRNDGISTDNTDYCPNDPNKTQPGQCGCGVAEGTCSPAVEIVTSPVQANAPIAVRYRNLPGNATDWVGLYRAGATDQTYVQYLYTSGATNGTLTFNGLAAGSYEARVFINDTYERVARVAFTVSSGTPTDNCPNDPNKTEPGQCGCGVAEGTCGAKTLSLSVDDSFVDSGSPNSNYGAGTLLEVDSSPRIQRVLIKPLGLSGVPARSRIESAQLVLQVVEPGNNMTVHKLSGSFSESGVTYSNAPAVGTSFATISGTSGSKTIDVTAVVQAWVNGEAARGFALYPTGSDGVDIASSEHSVTANRPVLRVTYRAQ